MRTSEVSCQTRQAGSSAMGTPNARGHAGLAAESTRQAGTLAMGTERKNVLHH